MTNQDQEQQPVGGFIFYRSFRDAIRQLPKNKQLALYDAICDYALDWKQPDLPGNILHVLWTLMKPSLDHTKKTTRSGPPRRGAPVGNHNASKHKQDEQPPKMEKPSKPSSTPSGPVSAPYADALRQPSQSKDPPVYREVTEIAQDQAWIESVCMLLHLQPDNLAPYFSLFRTECVSQGKHSHINLQDCKSHFTNWLRKQIEKRQKNEQSEKQRSLRRRNDVPDAGKTNYHSSL